MANELGPRLAVGNRAPAAFGFASDRRFYSYEEQYGRPVVLVLAGAGALDSFRTIMVQIIANLGAFAFRRADVLVMTEDDPAYLLARCPLPPSVRVVDSGDFLARCGVCATETQVLLLDRAMRLALVSNKQPGHDIARLCLEQLDRLPMEPARQEMLPAPVIMLPNLLTLDACRDLIDLFERSPTAEGGVARVDACGHAANVVDHEKKRRRDLQIDPEGEWHRRISANLLGMCRPEIAKAFQAHVAYVDRILISRYDDTGGWFRRHRDNDAAVVKFREFALSLNLNTGAYQGGHLQFPEYNDHRYLPPAGGGVIFSASMLHEAAPVTTGRRYVLLTFLHGELAERRRRELLKA